MYHGFVYYLTSLYLLAANVNARENAAKEFQLKDIFCLLLEYWLWLFLKDFEILFIFRLLINLSSFFNIKKVQAEEYKWIVNNDISLFIGYQYQHLKIQIVFYLFF